MAAEVISIGSDVLVRMDKLKNVSTDAYVNNATVTFVLKDADGATVVSSTTMSYVSGSDGKYEGTIPDTTSLTEDALYTIECTATSGSTVLFRKVIAQAKYRSNQ